MSHRSLYLLAVIQIAASFAVACGPGPTHVFALELPDAGDVGAGEASSDAAASDVAPVDAPTQADAYGGPPMCCTWSTEGTQVQCGTSGGTIVTPCSGPQGGTGYAAQCFLDRGTCAVGQDSQTGVAGTLAACPICSTTETGQTVTCETTPVHGIAEYPCASGVFGDGVPSTVCVCSGAAVCATSGAGVECL